MLIWSLVFLAAQAAGQDDKAAEKAAEKAAAEAVAVFDKAFKGADADRIAAIEALTKTPHLKTANRLAVVLGGMQSAGVRSAAVKALGKFTEAKKPAAAVLANALHAHAKEPSLFTAICAALVDLEDASSAPLLTRYFEDKDEYLATTSMATAGRLGSSVSVDPLISVVAHAERVIKAATNAAGSLVTDPATGKQYYSDPELRARDHYRVLLVAANKALQELSKEPSITSSAAWSAWWIRNKATFDRK